MGQFFKSFLWIVFVGIVVVAVIRIFPWNNPNEAWSKLGETSDTFSSWITGLVDKANIDEIPVPENPIVLPGQQVPATE